MELVKHRRVRVILPNSKVAHTGVIVDPSVSRTFTELRSGQTLVFTEVNVRVRWDLDRTMSLVNPSFILPF